MNTGSPGLRLHHVGFVVARISDSVQGFIGVFGASWDTKIFEDPIQKVKVTFLNVPGNESMMELVEPVGADSPVQRFLAQKGGGLHHVCYESGDLEQDVKAMRQRGAQLVRQPKPAVAFAGRRIAWVLTPEKLLVELLETKPST